MHPVRTSVMRSELNSRPQLLQYLEELYPNQQNHFQSLLNEARQNSDSLNKTQISLSNIEARILSTLIALFQPKKFVEVGTLTGYSALWIAHAMKKGQLFTIEKDPKHAGFATETLKKLKSEVEIQVLQGDAREVLHNLSAQAPFDAIFIDGNKAAYLDYLDWAEKNLRPGGLILADNVLAGGGVYGDGDGRFSEKMVAVLQEFNRRLAQSEKYESMLMPTSEGLFVALKKTH